MMFSGQQQNASNLFQLQGLGQIANNAALTQNTPAITINKVSGGGFTMSRDGQIVFAATSLDEVASRLCIYFQ